MFDLVFGIGGLMGAVIAALTLAQREKENAPRVWVSLRILQLIGTFFAGMVFASVQYGRANPTIQGPFLFGVLLVFGTGVVWLLTETARYILHKLQ